MQETHDPEIQARRRVVEVFDELRASGKTDQEIFGEAAAELKRLARKMTNREPAGASMHATRLLHDVYIRLFKDHPVSEFRWESGANFFLAVARAMHDLKVEYIRKKVSAKGGAGQVGSLDALVEGGLDDFRKPGTPTPPVNKNVFEAEAMRALEIDAALRRLRTEHPDREKAIILTY